MSIRSGKSSSRDNVKTLRAPLPPPATFSRTSSTDILELNHQQSQNGDSRSDRSIRSEVFGGGDDAAQSHLDRQHRVKARQAAEQEKTLARKQRNQKRSERVSGRAEGSVSCGSSVNSSITSYSSAPRITQQQEADQARLSCLTESLEGLEEEKPWYLQSTEELLKSEQMREQIEVLESKSVDSLSLSTANSHHSHAQVQKKTTADDDVSCVSSLSANSVKGEGRREGHQLAKSMHTRRGNTPRSANEAIPSRYTVRSLKAPDVPRRPPSPPRRPTVTSKSRASALPQTPGKASSSPRALNKSTTQRTPASPKKHPFLPNKSAPRASLPKAKKEPKQEHDENSTDPLLMSNTMLLAAPTEEDINQKFLLTREVDAHISDVEEEIRRLTAKQSAAKAVIKSTLSAAEEKEKELQDTQTSLAVLYEASLLAVQDKVRSSEEVESFLAKENIEGDNNRDPLAEKERKEFKQITVTSLERANTLHRERMYDPARYQHQVQRRDEGYLPSARTVADPGGVLAKVERIDFLWRRLRGHAREVGRRQVLLKKML